MDKSASSGGGNILRSKALFSLHQFEQALETLQETVEMEDITQVVKDATIHGGSV